MYAVINSKLLSIFVKTYNVYSHQIGTLKTSGIYTPSRNIKGFLKKNNNYKYKYKGNLISKFFQINESLKHRWILYGFALNEGFTEWLKGKVCGEPDTYINEVKMIEQIEMILGFKDTLKLGNGNYKELSELLGMSLEEFKEFVYYTDETLRAEYRKDEFEKNASMSNDENLSKKDSLGYKFAKIRYDFDDDLEKYDDIMEYFTRIKQQNLCQAEELLLEKTVIPKLEMFLKKEEISTSDIQYHLNINKSIENFFLNTDISLFSFTDYCKSYEKYLILFKDFEDKCLNYLKNNYNTLSKNDIEIVKDLYYCIIEYRNPSQELNDLIELLNIEIEKTKLETWAFDEELDLLNYEEELYDDYIEDELQLINENTSKFSFKKLIGKILKSKSIAANEVRDIDEEIKKYDKNGIEH